MMERKGVEDETIKKRKIELRRHIKILKSQLSEDQKQNQSDTIFKNLEKQKAFQNSSIILLYWSMEDEVHTHDFVEKWRQKKIILLPVVKGDTLLIRQYLGIGSMKKGEQFGILEPIGEEFTDIASIDMIVVPGVAFDKKNNRMGRGKGYYDKLLLHTKAKKVGVCFDFQFMEEIPVEKHDLPMDLVIKP